MELLEVFKDFEITVGSWTFRRKYTQRRKVVPLQNPQTLTKKDLQEYVLSLQKRYPRRGFKLRKYKDFYVIDQDLIDQEHYQEKKRIIEAIKSEEIRIRRTPLINAIEHYITLKVIEKLKNHLKQLRKNRKKDRIPLYFNLKEQKIYVPKTYVTKNRSLTNYICMRTLGALGISQSTYVRGGK